MNPIDMRAGLPIAITEEAYESGGCAEDLEILPREDVTVTQQDRELVAVGHPVVVLVTVVAVIGVLVCAGRKVSIANDWLNVCIVASTIERPLMYGREVLGIEHVVVGEVPVRRDEVRNLVSALVLLDVPAADLPGLVLVVVRASQLVADRAVRVVLGAFDEALELTPDHRSTRVSTPADKEIGVGQVSLWGRHTDSVGVFLVAYCRRR